MIAEIKTYVDHTGLRYEHAGEVIGYREWNRDVVWAMQTRENADLLWNAEWQNKQMMKGMVIAYAGVDYTLGDLAAAPINHCFEARFTAPGNPDHSQFAPIADARKFRTTTVEEMSVAARLYISVNDLGGGNWTSPNVYQWSTNAKSGRLTRKIYGKVYYSGCIVTVAEEKAENAERARKAAEASAERSTS